MAHSADPAEVPQGSNLGQPPQLPRLVVILLGLLGAAGAFWLMRQLSWLLAPAFLALNLVIVVYPVQNLLRRYGLPKPLAVAFTALTLVAVLVVITLVGVWAVSETITVVPTYMPEFTTLYQNILDWLVSIGVEQDAINSTWPTSTRSTSAGVTQIFSGFSGVVAMTGVILSAVIMMLDVPGGADGRHCRHPPADHRCDAGVLARGAALLAGLHGLRHPHGHPQLHPVDDPGSAAGPRLGAADTGDDLRAESVGFFFSLIHRCWWRWSPTAGRPHCGCSASTS